MQALQASFAGVRVAHKAQERSARRSTAAVRASDDKVTTPGAPRSKDTLYLGGIGASEQGLTYLDRSLPADYGFDPLGLLDPREAGGLITPEWLAYAEIIHCRWAMLGAAGCLAPEVLGKWGVIPAETGLPWYAAGVIPPAGAPEYWTDANTLFLGEMALMGFAEIRRLQDYRKPGSQGEQWFLGMEAFFKGSGKPAYPGGPFFNVLGYGKTDAEMATLKTKEVKNGRLAMLAMMGFFTQGAFTHASPVENLAAHLANPTAANILSTFSNVSP